MAVDEYVALRVSVFGVVQGVGFRPYIYRLAHSLELKGWVKNTSGNVTIHLEGKKIALEQFLNRLEREVPPLARIEQIKTETVSVADYLDFKIEKSSEVTALYQPVPPDVAVCPDCLRELFTPGDRRYHYPFINCTNCGPRYTIIQDVPYDRDKTTMSSFVMCPDCRREYENPLDRRFHAQPIACPVCGPHLWLEADDGIVQGDEAALKKAAEYLLSGKILAIKGLGGFHLAVDATNDFAVNELRLRKHRPHRALALMMTDIEMVRHYCNVDAEAEILLLSPECPIVLLPKKNDATNKLSALLAPDHDTLGVMLPYTPLHHLLLRLVEKPLVMTSANLSEEPLVIENEEARQRLGQIADVFLFHDRPIYMPCDDSVVFIVPQEDGAAVKPQLVRRARGYAPAPVHLRHNGRQVLAVGPELKNTCAVARDNLVFLSQHIGDLSNWQSWQHYLRIVKQLERLFHVQPEIIACDLHPDYESTRYAQERAQQNNLPLITVQHHYAHALSCITDVNWDITNEPVQAVVLDGTGYGLDGHIWGGEWLLLRNADWKRIAHLAYLPLTGGEAAIEKVDRLAGGYLLATGGKGLLANVSTLRHLQGRTGDILAASLRMANTPLTSSMGRLFDAVAAMLGLAKTVSYEAQAAIRLETLAVTMEHVLAEPYPWQMHADGVIDLNALLAAIATSREEQAFSAFRFHITVADIVGAVCKKVAIESGVETVVLSGGCFQNKLLLRLVMKALTANGLQPIIHKQVSCNDGGVALGQVTAARLATRT